MLCQIYVRIGLALVETWIALMLRTTHFPHRTRFNLRHGLLLWSVIYFRRIRHRDREVTCAEWHTRVLFSNRRQSACKINKLKKNVVTTVCEVSTRPESNSNLLNVSFAQNIMNSQQSGVNFYEPKSIRNQLFWRHFQDSSVNSQLRVFNASSWCLFIILD